MYYIRYYYKANINKYLLERKILHIGRNFRVLNSYNNTECTECTEQYKTIYFVIRFKVNYIQITDF